MTKDSLKAPYDILILCQFVLVYYLPAKSNFFPLYIVLVWSSRQQITSTQEFCLKEQFGHLSIDLYLGVKD